MNTYDPKIWGTHLKISIKLKCRQARIQGRADCIKIHIQRKEDKNIENTLVNQAKSCKVQIAQSSTGQRILHAASLIFIADKHPGSTCF